MLLSINQLSELTGKDRRTISNRVSNLPFSEGEKGAHLHESIEALAAIYGSASSLEEARARQALSQASLNAVREEDLRKTRIPVQIVLDVVDEALQSIGAAIKAAKNKKLTPSFINELFDKIRAVPLKLKW